MELYQLNAVIYDTQEVCKVFCRLRSVHRWTLHAIRVETPRYLTRLWQFEHIVEELRMTCQDALVNAERCAFRDEQHISVLEPDLLMRVHCRT